MKTQQPPQRGMKFAEAGILFILILGLTVFVGVRVASRDQQTAAQPAALTSAPADTGVIALVTAGGDPAEGLSDQAQDKAPAQPAAPPRIVTYAEAEQAYLAGRYEEAADLFSAYTEDRPGNAWGHYMLGMALWKAGDAEGAEEGFLTALLINPEHVKSLVNHGRVLLEMERPEEALTQVEKALELDTDNQDARRVLGRIFHNLGQLDEAQAAYLEILAADPQDAWSLNNLGLILIQRERFAAALPALARAALLKADTPCIQNNLGIALERSGYVAAAIQAYGRAVELASGYAKARQSLLRLDGRAESPDLAPFDLAAAAAQFSAGPSPSVGWEGDDLAVAAADPAPAALGKNPEDADDQNR